MRLSIDKPDLAIPDYEKLIQQGKFHQYMWYLGYIIWASEEILSISKNELWTKAIKYNLAYHADWISSPDFNYGEGYCTPEIVNLMKSATRDRDSLIEPFFRYGATYRPPKFNLESQRSAKPSKRPEHDESSCAD